MHPMLTIARRAADEAGKVIMRGFRQLDQIQVHEKGRGDLVSAVDQQAEMAIRRVLHDKFPHHDILGEEGGDTPADGAKKSEYQWIIDPLDGTANFLHGLPIFAVSIALVHQGKLEVGLVYNPVVDECFMAARGEGALLNERRIRTSRLRDGGRGVVATGFPYREPKLLAQQYAYLPAALSVFSDVRRLGAAALDLCYVACGRQDGFFEMNLNSWDIAAGVLIAQEAGAIVTDFAGEANMLENGGVVCANAYLHRPLLEALAQASLSN
ncbi:inositol monophosphatase family protein [Rappaport israeli]|uniref:inositol monophosphatase family protein n=1 Tax=Rappaport israeli TaxID=1839807 RepID=UPI000930768C|nr:inositol monophosphatase family protein [Rappaport israeli]